MYLTLSSANPDQTVQYIQHQRPARSSATYIHDVFRRFVLNLMRITLVFVLCIYYQVDTLFIERSCHMASKVVYIML